MTINELADLVRDKDPALAEYLDSFDDVEFLPLLERSVYYSERFQDVWESLEVGGKEKP